MKKRIKNFGLMDFLPAINATVFSFFRKMKIFPNADGGLGSNKIAIIALFFSQPV